MKFQIFRVRQKRFHFSHLQITSITIWTYIIFYIWIVLVYIQLHSIFVIYLFKKENSNKKNLNHKCVSNSLDRVYKFFDKSKEILTPII
jgi:hypothetical protein